MVKCVKLLIKKFTPKKIKRKLPLYHPETWPRTQDGKINYDAWVVRIGEVQRYRRIEIDGDLTKVY